MRHATISPIQKGADVPSFCEPVVLVRTRDAQFTFSWEGSIVLNKYRVHAQNYVNIGKRTGNNAATIVSEVSNSFTYFV